jgi:glycosyltransferase involved in cell wall biosynthesis
MQVCYKIIAKISDCHRNFDFSGIFSKSALVLIKEKYNMKIGIDAKWLFTGHISGKLFIQNILPELFALHPEIEWHIFLDKRNKDVTLPFKDDNIKIHYIWAKFNMVSNLFILPGHAKRLQLDAVLFQTFLMKTGTFKSIVFIHDILFKNYPQFFTWKERLYFKPLKWTTASADRVITTTEFVKKELIRFQYTKPHQPIDIAPSGVTNIFKPHYQHDPAFLQHVKEKYKLPQVYLLFAGRLNARKNIRGLIRSLKFLDDKNITLVIVGEENWKAPEINEFLSQKEMRERIILTGFVNDDELAAIYAMAKAFCFPSFAEGFGLPPLEAMASGIPVIVSDTTAMPEVCNHAALFIDPGNPKNIAEKINSLLKNETLYEEKKREGLEWSRQFTWKRTAEGIMQSVLSAVKM